MPDIKTRISQNGKYDCCGCKLCEEICPQRCISMKNDMEGFWYPDVDYERCTECGLCDIKCPNVIERNYNIEPQVYAAYAKDEGILKSSSSGGIFQLLAIYILEQKGVVYGAAFDENLSVCHCRVEAIEELEMLLGSKYVQSDMNSVYQLIKNDLKRGVKVLFSGTPCQVAAVKSFVGNDVTNIWLVDLICHGVPSPEIWQQYLETQIKNQEKVEKFIFRSQENEGDWENYICKKIYRNQDAERMSYQDFLYGRGFVSDIFLRPSCYECKYLALSSGADITLGDFWGIKDKYPEYYNASGVSVVSTNTVKGNELFAKIKSQCIFKESNVYYLEQGNVAFSSSKRSVHREEYLDRIEKNEDKLLVVESCLNSAKYKNKKIILFGSYNTRVAINETEEKLIEQYSYSSLKSLLGNKLSEELSVKPKDFVEAMLYKDKCKSFIRNIRKLSEEAEYIVIDLLEERFPVKYERDFCYTQNIDFFSGDEKKKYNYDKEYYQWQEACNGFIDIIQRYFGNERIIFVESYLCTHWGMHGRYAAFERINEISKFNEYLKKCNRYFIEKSGVDKIITIPEELQYTQKYHRYGCKPYHLNYDAYQKMGKQLREFLKNKKEML